MFWNTVLYLCHSQQDCNGMSEWCRPPDIGHVSCGVWNQPRQFTVVLAVTSRDNRLTTNISGTVCFPQVSGVIFASHVLSFFDFFFFLTTFVRPSAPEKSAHVCVKFFQASTLNRVRFVVCGPLDHSSVGWHKPAGFYLFIPCFLPSTVCWLWHFSWSPEELLTKYNDFHDSSTQSKEDIIQLFI